MLICSGETALACGKLKASSVGAVRCLRLDIFAPASPGEIKRIFSGGSFYFRDEITGSRLPDTDTGGITGLRIVYQADSVCKIIIKLKEEGVVMNEN